MAKLAVKRTWMSSGDYEKLRESFDSNDRFMQFPNVVAGRLGSRVVPEWMRDSNGGVSTDAVRKFLRKKFPYANKTNRKCNCRRCPQCDYFQYVSPLKRYSSRNRCECRECRETTLILKWWIVIWGVYDERKTASQIELSEGWNPGTVGYIVQQIKRASTGIRLDGKPRTGRPRGRPPTKAAVEKIAPTSVAA